jgi:Tfp pilus assembly protein PilZ
VVKGTTRDLSVGGAFVEGADIPAFGSKVILSLNVPGQGELKLAGIIRWTKPEGFGVQFQLLGARETYLITRITSNK